MKGLFKPWQFQLEEDNFVDANGATVPGVKIGPNDLHKRENVMGPAVWFRCDSLAVRTTLNTVLSRDGQTSGTRGAFC